MEGTDTCTQTHSRHMVHSTQGQTQAPDTHVDMRSYVQLHTHARQNTTDSKMLRDNAITQQTNTETHVHTLTYTVVGSGAEAAQSCGVDPGIVPRDPKVRGASCEQPEGAQSRGGESGPCPHTDVAAPPGPGPRPATGCPKEGPPSPPRGLLHPPPAPGPARGPSRPPPAPGPPHQPPGAPQPRRRLGSAARQRRAELAKQQTARHVGVDGRGAPISPSRASGQSGLGRGGGAAATTCSRPARHTRTHAGHTHTHILPPPPRAAPGHGHTLSHGPGAQHTRHIPGYAASTHGHTHLHPLQTRSYTRIPDTLRIHSDPHSPRRRTPPTPDTPTRPHRAHSARTHTFRTRSHAFTHVHGSHKHTHHTRVP